MRILFLFILTDREVVFADREDCLCVNREKAPHTPPPAYYEAMNASYVEKMANFEQIKYTFKLTTLKKPSDFDLESVTKKLIDQ